MNKNIKNLSYLIQQYILKEGSGLAAVLDSAANTSHGINKVGKAGVFIANYAQFSVLARALEKYTDNLVDLQKALNNAGENVNISRFITALENAKTSGDAAALSRLVPRAEGIEQAIKRAERTADFATDAKKVSGAGAGAGTGGTGAGAGGTGAGAGAGAAVTGASDVEKVLTRANFVTQEGFDIYQNIKRLEKIGANETQLASLNAKMLKLEGIVDEIVDADQALLKRMSDLDQQIATKRAAGALSEAERLERLKLKEAGGTRYERLKMWIRQNPKKAFLLGSAAAYLGYLGFTATPSGEVKPTPTPKPGPGGGGGGSGGGGTKWKKCDDTEIKKGCMGDNVKNVQNLLIGKDYKVGKQGADGKFGSNTETALKKFQKDNGLSPTGVVDAETMEKLNSGTSATISKEEDKSGASKTTTDTTDKSGSSEQIRDVLDLRQQMYYGEKVLEKMGVSAGSDMTQAKVALDKILRKKFRNVSRQITIKEIEEAANEVKGDFPGLFSNTVSESIQKGYYINPIKNRHDQVEKLVFERMVKNAR